MIDLAIRHNRSDIIPLLELAKKQGLRIHEAIRLSKSDIEKALRTSTITVKGKGGLVREVPLRSDVKVNLETVSKRILMGKKYLFQKVKKHIK
ncbi:tyrosine-type recombinase/integrase [Calidifontibacillus oryziterrae]|uniref:tyrosine-type recombinase/integrase n=1 Tax=Calidifontibacillus oryziterrae TaxID=1191699 RepID=UPI00030EBA60|nr:tyrosine-type recombinase/integrase [Calidifontibacillus oryziterrae]